MEVISGQVHKMQNIPGSAPAETPVLELSNPNFGGLSTPRIRRLPEDPQDAVWFPEVGSEL
jgi:hypothetical protein